MNRDAKIFVAGHGGFVGSAIVRALRQRGCSRLILKPKSELDLRDALQVQYLFRKEQPEYVFLTAAHVGGSEANRERPADLIRDNLMIQHNVIDASYQTSVKKLLFLGSACLYPKHATQPMKEHALLTGALEEANEPYSIAKIAGIKMCQAYNKQYQTRYITAMPTKLYGLHHPNDGLHASNTLAALFQRFHEATQRKLPHVEILGSRESKSEFLHVDDLADACLFLMDRYEDSEIINVGTGIEVTLRELAEKIKAITGYLGEIVYTAHAEAEADRIVDIAKINGLGWQADIKLDEGLRSVYAWVLRNESLLTKH
ncbi:GDP-L-fucose synthase family protein [Paenibacillus silvisoli]|uniref:GDP-L-fucose synthase family protein n=1 Tax=Paenibacillus silvisoli TaxID=3110539 RepID=UPI0028054C26|nr:GDP-L-fucose synthase [Paenibacillus silvisoli]